LRVSFCTPIFFIALSKFSFFFILLPKKVVHQNEHQFGDSGSDEFDNQNMQPREQFFKGCAYRNDKCGVHIWISKTITELRIRYK